MTKGYFGISNYDGIVLLQHSRILWQMGFIEGKITLYINLALWDWRR